MLLTSVCGAVVGLMCHLNSRFCGVWTGSAPFLELSKAFFVLFCFSLRKKGFFGVLDMKHRVLYSTPKDILC